MNRYWTLILKIQLAVIVSMLTACAHDISPTNPVDELDEFVNRSEPQRATHVPDDVNDALLNHQAQQVVDTNRDDVRFDVSVNNIPAKAFFVSLVSEAGVNVVAHPDIEGYVSLDLTNVSVKEVLDVVRDVYGYEYQYKSNIYTIYPRKLRTQSFHIDYLDIKRVGVTDTSVLIGDINSNSSSSNSGGGNSGSNSSSGNSANLLGSVSSGNDGESSSSQGQSFSPGARVQTLNATDFWGFLQVSLESIIGGGEDGRFVMTNPHAGIVVARALPVELSAIRDFLRQSELSIQRQVILETKILEVQLNERHETGINWAAIGGALSLEYNTAIGDADLSGVIGGENISETLFSSVLGITDITKLISLLDRQGDVSVLSSPRISTVNNQKAVIRVGSDEFFVTGVSNSTTASASSVTNTPEVELSSFFSGISLDVTPQIAEDGDVIIHVHPIVSDVKDQLKEIQVGDDNFSLPLALRDVRESDSIVRAASGQVVVLGGLMQESSSEVDTRRSRLGDIPILNVFFKHEAKQMTKTELVILMRPVVIENDEWGEHIQYGRTGLQHFNNER